MFFWFQEAEVVLIVVDGEVIFPEVEDKGDGEILVHDIKIITAIFALLAW